MAIKAELIESSPSQIRDIKLFYTAIYGNKNNTRLTNFSLRLEGKDNQLVIGFNLLNSSFRLNSQSGKKSNDILVVNFANDEAEVIFNGEGVKTKGNNYLINFPFGDNNFTVCCPKPEQLKNLIEALGEISLQRIPLPPIDRDRNNFLPFMSEEIKRILREYGFGFHLSDKEGNVILNLEDSLFDK